VLSATAVGASVTGTVSPLARADGVVQRTAVRLGLPSVSFAVVQNGKLAHVRAYGDATVNTRYEIGSISKQFTAACILMLQQKGRLRLDDPLAKFLPNLPHARDVTIRQLLDQTSGYPDYYATLSDPALFKDTTLTHIVDEYAAQPLDFAPGTSWEYSNTGYAILTQVVEKVSGMPYGRFVTTRIFEPLHMDSAIYEQRPAFGRATAVGYDRILLGSKQPARPEGRDWLNGAAGLAMTAQDLARWDIALLNQTLLTADSTRAMFSEQHLKSGASTGYGLGVFVTRANGVMIVSHEGEVQGFTSENGVIPSKQFAVVVLCNQENSAAPGFLSGAIAGAFGLFPIAPDPPAGSVPIPPKTAAVGDTTALSRVREVFYALADGRVSSQMMTPGEATIATASRLEPLRSRLAAFGPPVAFESASHERRGTVLVSSAYIVLSKNRALTLTVGDALNGKITDILLEPR